LEQTYDPIEVIVVDDSGEAHARSVAREYDVRYFAHGRNQGGNPARNTGLENASGQYVQFLDDDDRITRSKIENQVESLESAPNAGVVYCGLEYERGEEVLPDPDCRGNVLERALRFDMNPCQTGTMLIERDVLDRIQPLVNRDAADDIGMKIRLAMETEFEFVDEVLFYKGDSKDNRSRKVAFADELERMLRRFDEEYEAASKTTRRVAKRKIHEHRGYRVLNERRWSARAIRSFALALLYKREFDPMLIAALLTSLFGSPGHTVASKGYNAIFSGD
jgi:glycosyltransferase involved in cell wall biosynthesis